METFAIGFVMVYLAAIAIAACGIIWQFFRETDAGVKCVQTLARKRGALQRWFQRHVVNALRRKKLA